MKTFQSMVIVASIILVSTSVTAEPLRTSINKRAQTDSNTLEMNAESSKQAAYQLGLRKLTQLKAMPPKKLNRALHVGSSRIDVKTLHLEGNGYVTVEERMDTDGKPNFVSVVHVASHYLEYPRRNN